MVVGSKSGDVKTIVKMVIYPDTGGPNQNICRFARDTFGKNIDFVFFVFSFRQVVLSGDFVPHLEHGAVVSRPLRPQRSHGSTSNLAARGSLSFQLMLRRGGESLASEFERSAITVEVLEAKGLPPSGPALAPGMR